MEKNDQNYSSPSLLSPNSKQFIIPSPRKNIPHPNNNDRLKRDEWSEGAVSTLLEAYEEKWILRNRAKLKGQDWEEVSKQVSGRSNNTKSSKTQTQCKNKIESMKKRYRSESASTEVSSWPLYPRLNLLLRGNGSSAAAVPQLTVMHQLSPPVPPSVLQDHIMHGSDGNDQVNKVDDHINVGAKSVDQEPKKNNLINDSDGSSTPATYTRKDHENKKTKPGHNEIKDENKKQRKNKRKNSEDHWGIGKSIRWVAEVVTRCEETRMETMKEIERMRAEAEVKRGEMDLKRTEIIANTQLEIAKLFANVKGGGSVDSSNLMIGRS